MRKEVKRKMKFVTFFIDIGLKVIFLILIGFSMYMTVLSKAWFDFVVTKECTGSDISLYP